MKIEGACIYEGFTGLSNQLFSLLIRIQQARRANVDLLLIDDFMMGLDTKETCAIDKIFCMDSLNEAAYPVVVSGRRSIGLKIDKVEYGREDHRIDVTSHFMDGKPENSECRLRKFEIPKSVDLNAIGGDPCPFQHKSLFITYCVDSHYPIVKTYKEDCHHISESLTINLDAISYPFRFGWVKSEGNKPEFDDIMRKIRFHPSFYKERPMNMVVGPRPKGRMHVLHLRVEPDGIAHWSHYNRMSHSAFEEALHRKYIDILDTHLLHPGAWQEGDHMLVLSYSESNPVLDHLKEKGCPYMLIEKNRCRGREWNAIVDMAMATSKGDGFFFGNFNLYLLRGSTFSYVLHTLMKHRKKSILIDLDELTNKPIVVESPLVSSS